MADYNSRYARKSFSKPFTKGSADRFGGPKTLHKAQCASCNATCEVPFIPNGKKPVFCRNCFVKDEGSASRPSYSNKREWTARPSFSRSDQSAPARDDRGLQDLKLQLQGVNDKLTHLISVMEATPKPSKKK